MIQLIINRTVKHIMEQITAKDRAVLRRLAERKAGYAQDEKNKAILKKWYAQAECRREMPTVRLLFSNLRGEIILPQMQCTGEIARRIEETLIHSMVGRDLFDDDTPTSPTFDMYWDTWVEPFGLLGKREENLESKGYHIEPVIEDLESDFEMLKGGSFGGKGITPNKEVSLTAEQQAIFPLLTEKTDPQLKAALEQLNTSDSNALTMTTTTTLAPQSTTSVSDSTTTTTK